ncbi:CRISPR-associated helicase Cas3' [Amycolatopsis acidicola]|uniref:CRISPR-associated helicase Cas3 n=2 Tax=Amycolatopsis acidicola TaxID=2596893 RepID=A0A5N0UX75_9PSEU|nr:CRISPR-associated helicase Cas3' [Amycolatopsis acidicola]
MMDTIAVARRLAPFLLRGRVHEELEVALAPLGDAWGWAALLCGVHDLGKCSPGFQALNLPLAAARIGAWGLPDVEFVARPAGVPGRVDTPHGIVTTLQFRDLLFAWGATTDTAICLAAVLGGHHGHFPAGQDLAQARREVNNRGGDAWESARTGLVMQLAKLVRLPDPRTLPWGQVHMTVPAAVGLAALTTVSDWIASDERNFRSPGTEFDLGDYVTLAQTRADTALERLKMLPWRPPEDPRFSVLFGESPRPVQDVVERVVGDLTEPALVLVEAPTGEGKTKAGLQAAASMVRTNNLTGVYVALPTQSSSNQVFDVAREMLAHLGDPTDVQLVHSAASDVLAALPSGIGADDGDDSDVAARTWFTRKRNLLAALGIGTIDQPLKGAFRSGHVFVRLAGLAGKVVVVDEVHAYDTYMSASLRRLLAWLGALGVSVVLLSATLPSNRRQDLLAAWQAGVNGRRPHDVTTASTETPYPRVTVVQATGAWSYPAELTGLNQDRAVHLEHVDDSRAVDWLLARAAQQQCVAVVHNLVRRAVDTYAELERRIALLPPDERPLLIAINGTLPRAARRNVERELRNYFGADGRRPTSAIVVGTQVLEQSLDLDFDALVTDLAPIDSMLQRIGRVHRHRRDPLRGNIVVAVAGVVDTQSGPRFPPYLRTVYAPAILLRTWAALKDRDRIESWTTTAELVDQVYCDRIPCPQGWEEMWAREHQRLLAAQRDDAKAAELNCLPLPHLIEDLFELTERPKPPRPRKSTGARK